MSKQTEAERLADDCEIACAAACNCMTKTPDPKFHTTHCRYRCLTRSSAELRRLAALNAELVAELKTLHRNYRMHVDTISNWAIAMQAAVIAARNVDHEEGMMWIDSTLEGPGLLPPADFGGSAQEWADVKTAEHEKWRADHPVKYQGDAA